MFCYVSEKKKIILFYNLKSGFCLCSDIFKQLEGIEGDIKKYYYRKNLPKDYKNYKKILFVRSPYKRLYSGLCNRILKDSSKIQLFKENNIVNLVDFLIFIKKSSDPHFKSQFEIYPKIKFDNIFDLDNLNEEKLKQEIGKDIIIRKINHSNYNSDLKDKNLITYIGKKEYPTLENIIDNGSKKLIQKIYYEDFQILKSLGFNY